MFAIFQPGTDIDVHVSALRETGERFSTFNSARFPIVVSSGEFPQSLKDDPNLIEILESYPRYPLVGRHYDPSDAEVKIGGVTFGPGNFGVVAGPCSVTQDSVLSDTALRVRNAGACALRGGVYKPRTSPYAFQGLGEDGFDILDDASRIGLPVISEVMSIAQIEALGPHVDAFQIGARNTQNFDLLKAVGRSDKPVVLKQGFGCTLDEFLHSAEYILAEGNNNVVLVVRGIRSFENATRFTLDIGAVAWLKKNTRLPVVVDPSHAIGIPDLIVDCSRAAAAVGADGLMLEVHPSPDDSPSDPDQALTLEMFETLMPDIESMAQVVGRKLQRVPTLQPIDTQKQSS